MGTLIEIILCLLLYFFPYPEHSSEAKKEELDGFFKQLSTPIREEDKPAITPQYKKVLSSLFIFSFLVAGVLFCAISLPSLKTLGGRYSFIAGVACFVLAAVLWLVKRMRKASNQ